MEHVYTINDVKSFFRYLYSEQKLNFHPDEKFESYIDFNTGLKSFTPEECDLFNQLMDECFSVCESSVVDIYELGTQTFNELAVV